MVKEIFVVYLDILGYSNKINRYKLEELAKEMKYLIKKESEYPFPYFSYRNVPNQKIDTTGIEYAIASDTILLYTKGKTCVDFDFLIRHVHNLFVGLILKYYPLRGVIDYGELYADKKEYIYIGKALVNAHKKANKLDWAGVMVTKNCEKEIEINNDLRETVDGIFKCGWLTKYEVPLKTEFKSNNMSLKINYSEQHTILNWAPWFRRSTPISQEEFWEWFTGPKNNIMQIKPDVEKKIQNTYDYYLAHYNDEYI